MRVIQEFEVVVREAEDVDLQHGCLAEATKAPIGDASEVYYSKHILYHGRKETACWSLIYPLHDQEQRISQRCQPRCKGVIAPSYLSIDLLDRMHTLFLQCRKLGMVDANMHVISVNLPATALNRGCAAKRQPPNSEPSSNTITLYKYAESGLCGTQILSEEALETLISDVKDWQITHGSLLKLVRTEDEHTVLSQPVGCTLFPTLFPRNLFQEALSLQAIYNKLYAAVAEDEEWLYETLKDLIDVDPLANALWSIYQEVKREGVLQNITLGIFRSDYMLHNDAQDTSNGLGLKQVEFNTVSCAGGVHGNRISEMHRHLYRTGMYQQHSDSTSGSPSTVPLDTSSLPRNSTLPMLVSGLKSAHDAYRPALSRGNSRKTCIIFIVQPYNFNIADERPIEYALWDESIANFRVTWGHEVLSQTSLTPSGELIYSPPERSISYEVSVVYFRAGFEVHEFNDIGHMARFQLEKSRAIKCPSLLSHLTTFKKVQQALALPNALDRFLNSEEAALVSKTFAPQYPLDTSAFGQHARKLATDPKTAKSFILKPSLEGGGHNFYGEDIVAFLKATPKEMWHQYVLMEKITPPLVKNFLMSSRGLYEGPVISELGVFRICLWERKTESGGKIKAEMLDVQEPCWSFKTKDASVNEMSVVKGYGCFDSPALVDSDVFLSLLERK